MIEYKNGVKTFYAKSRDAWRTWLAKNHPKEKSVWLIMYRKQSDIPSLSYEDAVHEALCFGWIDSKAIKRDGESRFQSFTKRNKKSNWSKLNKQRVEQLIQQGLMTAAGLQVISLAKQNGSWNAMDEVEEFVMPDDFQKALSKSKTARKNFEAFSPSSRKITLGWIHNAKRPETRQKRINESVALAVKNISVSHVRQQKYLTKAKKNN